MSTKKTVKLQTKKPTGLSIKRSGNKFVCSWKIGDKDYGSGQIFRYKLGSGKWTAVNVGNTTTSKTVTVTTSAYFPTTSKKLSKFAFEVRGLRREFETDTKAYSFYESDWAVKEFDILIPQKPSLSAALDSTYNNKTTFTWSTTVKTDSLHWFSDVQCQTVLLEESGITDGSKVTGWVAYSASSASGSATITEDTSVINNGKSHTRWFRIRSRGPQGCSDWAYAKHVYASPLQVKNTAANVSTVAAGGYLCRMTWASQNTAAHPIDTIEVQYAFAIPASGMACPDTASWSDAMSLAYKDGSDAATFSIESSVGQDQCLFVRVNTVHDRTTTYGSPVTATVGTLKSPTISSVSMDQSTYKATVTATNASDVPGAFQAIYYMDADNPDGICVGVIPNGSTSAIVQCPTWTATNAVRFGVRAVVGSSSYTTRSDSVLIYKIDAAMQSAMVTYGGTVPAAPSSVTAEMTNIPGTIRVAWAWSWGDATAAELSWADHADAWESTDEPSTYIVSNTRAGIWNISGLETGKTWYLRVRLASGYDTDMTFGAYSDIISIDLSSAPAIPILSLSEAVITQDGSVTASWAFSSGDGTGQGTAELAEVIVSGGTTSYVTLASTLSAQYADISAERAGWSTGTTHDIAVRVTSVSGRRSGWSDPVSVAIAAPITATITTTSLEVETITTDGASRTVNVLTEMPLTLTVTGAGAGGTTRVVIERAEAYHVDRPDETEFNGFEGETIAIYSQVGEAGITIDDLIGHLDDGAVYRIIATVQDGFGQSADAEIEFEVHWDHQAIIPSANVVIDGLIAKLTPVAPAGTATGDTCDIYRLSVDRPELIYPDAAFGTTYVDPYPTIGENGGHRFVFKTANGDYITANNELAWYDVASEVEGDAAVIDFGNGRVTLGYNVDLSHSWQKDFTETKYLGGSVQGDWNPAVSRTGTVAAVVVSDDDDMIEAMRRLAVYTGICHVRTKDGSSYAADVQVSETQKQDKGHRIVEFTLSITRVDTEGYDGMTLAEWERIGD